MTSRSRRPASFASHGSTASLLSANIEAIDHLHSVPEPARSRTQPGRPLPLLSRSRPPPVGSHIIGRTLVSRIWSRDSSVVGALRLGGVSMSIIGGLTVYLVVAVFTLAGGWLVSTRVADYWDQV